mmetsp:Transcript_61577/g.159908  ORF Transcript_61577/g.159908 Transcript_61577/m.159908 type:complete len:250 (-) Transcript_61577:687-1436(-)
MEPCTDIDVFFNEAFAAVLKVWVPVFILLSRLPFMPPMGGSTMLPSSWSSDSPPPPPAFRLSGLMDGRWRSSRPASAPSLRSCVCSGAPSPWSLALLPARLTAALASLARGSRPPWPPLLDASRSSGAAATATSFSASRSSRKNESLSACRAKMRSSGSYLMSFFISSVSSRSAWGINLSRPVPFFSGKLKSMCDAFLLNFCASSLPGVPSTLWIFWIWSFSFCPGKSGNRATTSKQTQPAANRSILKL